MRIGPHGRKIVRIKMDDSFFNRDVNGEFVASAWVIPHTRDNNF